MADCLYDQRTTQNEKIEYAFSKIYKAENPAITYTRFSAFFTGVPCRNRTCT